MRRVSAAGILLLLCCVSAAPTTQPEIRRGLVTGGSPAVRSRRYFARLVTLAEPTGRPDPARLPAYLAVLKREVISDPRIVAFAPVAQVRSDHTLLLSGFAEYPELIDTTVRFLSSLGFAQIEDRMELLPSAKLGDKPFALVVSNQAFLYDKPERPHEMLTQALPGDPLFLLAREGDFYLCHSADGYVGYVAADDVRAVQADVMKASLDAPQVTVTKSFSQGKTFYPTGAHLRLAPASPDRRLAGAAHAYEVAVYGADGDVFAAPADHVRGDGTASQRIDRIIAAAQQSIGTRYVWGGRTSQGIDCSGLIQSAFQSQDIILPRDADQQALCGTLVATRGFRAALRRGDLLFFISSRGSIHHVAMYLGNDQFLEAVTPFTRISSFNSNDVNYTARRDDSFAFAKRVLQ